MRDPAIVIPNYTRSDTDLEVLELTLRTLRAVEPEVRCLVVDDGSPAPSHRRDLARLTSGLQSELILKDDNEGFSRTVNTGIRMAMADGMDVILANADLEFDRPFVQAMTAAKADVIGALLIYPNGLIQHAGQYFSLLTRTFGHVYRYAPADLPEAQLPARRPVTHALALIRHEALTEVGLFDERFRMGHEDVDFNVRVMRSGGVCGYLPAVRVTHHESIFRGQPSPQLDRWHRESWAYFRKKWARENLGQWVPSI